MPFIGLALVPGASSLTTGVLVPPAGYVFLVDADGYYLTDDDGYYLLEDR